MRTIKLVIAPVVVSLLLGAVLATRQVLPLPGGYLPRNKLIGQRK